MVMDAQQVADLQNSQPPTDWSKFDSVAPGTIGGPGGLPHGMGPGHDDKLHVHFFNRPQIDVEKSTIENRPVFKNVPHITIMIPGDKNNIPTSVVMDLHKRRFPEQWRQFLAGQEEQLIGTPLHVAPFMTDTLVQELAYFKIRTVEQLASMPDGNMTFMGARALKKEAIAYLDKARGADAMASRIAELEAKLAAMEEAKKVPQSAAEQSAAEQSAAGQSAAEQSAAEQSAAEQSAAETETE